MIHQGPAENRRVIGVRVEPPTRSDRSGAQGLPPSTPPPRSLTGEAPCHQIENLVSN